MQAIWAPPPDLTIAQWGDEYYVLPLEHGGGQWTTKNFQRGILDAMCDPDEERVTVKKSMRVGYTKMVDLVIGYHMDADPCSILVVQPTIPDAEGFSKDEIEPMLADVPALMNKVAREDNTLTKKRYPGGTLTIVGANSATGFRRLTVRIVILDEVSAYPADTGQDGDPVRQAEGRSFSAFNRKILAGSTPTKHGFCRIDKSFQASDQRFFHVPCPHCEHRHVLDWKNFKYPEGKPHLAHFVCPSCGEAIHEKDKQAITDAGQWRSLKAFTCCDQEQKPEQWDDRGRPICKHCELPHITGHAGFHIWAAYSDLPNARWGKLAEYYESVKDSPEELQVFINTILGETYREETLTFEGKPLYDRREEYGDEYGGTLPEGVRIVLASVDTQDNRLEMKVVGFGEGQECWVLNRTMFHGRPDDENTQAQLLRAMNRLYRHPAGMHLPITMAAVDVQGHFYDDMMRLVATYPDRFVAIRGGNKVNAPATSPPTRNNMHRIPLYTLGVNNIKTRLARRLKYKYPGNGFIHFPKGNDFEMDYFEQLTAESVTTEDVSGIPYERWTNDKKARNEAWDLLVYCLALLWLINPDLSELPEGITDEDDEPDEDEPDDDYYEENDWINS
ncbi:terminase gpA endonuclease subunit [Rheinheimera sp.]|uniref:phage terminase large subunit family protein n=1 Tax=Rheinheimera sp. TaxID=1869214 RepID=UPI00307EF1B6